MKLQLIILSFIVLALLSCSYPRNFTRDFYRENESKLEALKNDFKILYHQKPFAVLFEEKKFNHVNFEFITDTLKRIYHFNINENSLKDSLDLYQYNSPLVLKLIREMKEIQCTWINNIEYYVNLERRNLVMMAVRNKALNKAFKGESYCTLVFFERPQLFDEKGIFIDRADKKRRRQLNGYVLHKVNDSVGYAITKVYR